MRNVWCGVVIIAAMFVGEQASAADGCTVSVEAGGVGFGSFNPLTDLPRDTIGHIHYNCTNVGNIWIDLSKGYSSSYARFMKSGTKELLYNLYLDEAHATIWGDKSVGTDHYATATPPSNGVDVDVSVHGNIPVQQNISAGTYTDTIQVTITF